MTLKNIASAYEQYKQDVVASAKACVEEGGGIWVGIQEGEWIKSPRGRIRVPDLALFNSKQTGTTLALKTTEITPKKVLEKLKRSNAQFGNRELEDR
jgi:hypothetical protein